MVRPKGKMSTFVIAAVMAAVAPVFVMNSVTLAGFPEDAEYVGHQQCKVCHNKPAEGEQWNVWQSMKHSKALEVLKTDEAKQVAAEEGLEKPPHESPECLQCHVTAYDVEAKKAPEKIDLADGVQCETCHGPGSLHIQDGRKLMFAKGDAADAIDVAANHWEPTEERCVECHNADNPTWDPERYTLENGEKVGFDYEQAVKIIAHPNPQKAEEEE